MNKRTTTRKPTAKPEPTLPLEEITKKPSRATKKESAPEVAAKPKVTRSSKKTEPSTEPEAKPKRSPKKPVEPANDREILNIVFRPRTERPADEPKNERSGGRRRVSKKEVSEPVATTEQFDPQTPRAEVLEIIEWRAATAKPVTSPLQTRKNREPRQPREAREPREQRERKPKQNEPVQAPKPEPELTPPPVIHREPIPIPPEAPRVVNLGGHTILTKDKIVYPPFFFFGAALDEKRANTVFEEIRMASENGIKVFYHYVELILDPVKIDAATAFAGYLLRKTLEINSDAQVIFRLVLAAPSGWEKQFPDAHFIDHHGQVADPSVCDDNYWENAEECVDGFVKSMRKLDEADHILGVHLDRGEWFSPAGAGYDTSKSATAQFRTWCRLRYRNDHTALRAAWFNGSVDFETLNIPTYSPGESSDFVLTNRKQRPWVDYHLFFSDITVQRIGNLAYTVKKASEGHWLVGVSYGYTFEWSHAASGHISVGKLLRTQEIDIIAGPPSYLNREPGGSCPFPGPIDSYGLNGKLYLSEEDFKTPISNTVEHDDFNPVIRTPQALENVQYRGVGAALAHESGVCWMDSWGNGWLNTPGIWNRGKLMHETFARSLSTEAAAPDMAVFIDERSLAYLADHEAFTLLVRNVREAVLRSGLSVGFYLLSDLAHREHFPDCKVYVFMNAWDVRPEVRSAIKAKLQRDKKVLFWLYAASLFDSGRDALERVREITGIALKTQPFACTSGTTMVNKRHPLCEALPEDVLASGGQLEPSFFAIPEDGVVLGEYSQTGLPSFVIRTFDNPDKSLEWTSVFLGEPVVTPALFRALGQIAGVQAWNYHDDVVHARPPFLTVHCSHPGSRSVALPEKWSAYNLCTQEWATLDSTHLRFSAMDGSTYIFLVGPKSELDEMLNLDLTKFLTLKELPEQKPNTVDHDALTFDVPIMKLGEWMEEGWTDELADDLLLKPSQLEIDPLEPEAESPNRTRGRRRRRSRGGPDRGFDFEPAASSGGEDMNLGVVFRKRN